MTSYELKQYQKTVAYNQKMASRIPEKIPCYVYIIQCGEFSNYKIGSANNIEERLFGLQLGCPFTLQVIGSRRFDTKKDAMRKELVLHEAFYLDELSREWFELDDSQLKKVTELLLE